MKAKSNVESQQKTTCLLALFIDQPVFLFFNCNLLSHLFAFSLIVFAMKDALFSEIFAEILFSDESFVLDLLLLLLICRT